MKKEKIIKRIVPCVLVGVLCVSVLDFNINTEVVKAEEVIPIYSDNFWSDSVKHTNIDDYDEDEDFPEYLDSGMISIITVMPAKKIIKRKKSFNIKITLKKEFTEDKEPEEIDDILERNIDNITFRSTRSSIASVNRKGMVTAKKKGTSIIKTTITFMDGLESVYKTKVYVK